MDISKIQDKEIRIYSTKNIDLKLRALPIDDDNKLKIIEGYAAVFNQPSKVLYDSFSKSSFMEIIKEGAFDQVLADPDLDCIYTFNHNDDNILARTTNGTLTLSVDSYGLKYRAVLSNDDLGERIYALVQSQTIYENSFAFCVGSDSISEVKDENGGVAIRTIMEVRELFDTSAVTRGAYANTTIVARELIEQLKAPKQDIIDPNIATRLNVAQSLELRRRRLKIKS